MLRLSLITVTLCFTLLSLVASAADLPRAKRQVRYSEFGRGNRCDDTSSHQDPDCPSPNCCRGQCSHGGFNFAAYSATADVSCRCSRFCRRRGPASDGVYRIYQLELDDDQNGPQSPPEEQPREITTRRPSRPSRTTAQPLNDGSEEVEIPVTTRRSSRRTTARQLSDESD